MKKIKRVLDTISNVKITSYNKNILKIYFSILEIFWSKLVIIWIYIEHKENISVIKKEKQLIFLWLNIKRSANKRDMYWYIK